MARSCFRAALLRESRRCGRRPRQGGRASCPSCPKASPIGRLCPAGVADARRCRRPRRRGRARCSRRRALQPVGAPMHERSPRGSRRGGRARRRPGSARAARRRLPRLAAVDMHVARAIGAEWSALSSNRPDCSGASSWQAGQTSSAGRGPPARRSARRVERAVGVVSGATGGRQQALDLCSPSSLAHRGQQPLLADLGVRVGGVPVVEPITRAERWGRSRWPPRRRRTAAGWAAARRRAVCRHDWISLRASILARRASAASRRDQAALSSSAPSSRISPTVGSTSRSELSRVKRSQAPTRPPQEQSAVTRPLPSR